MFPYSAVSITEMRFTFLYGYDKMYKQNLFSIQKGRCFMKIKKYACGTERYDALYVGIHPPSRTLGAFMIRITAWSGTNRAKLM